MRKTAALYLALLLLPPLSAQTFRPFAELRVIKTEKFDIVFSERSRATAEALARFADRTYERVSSLLGIAVPGRIPVTITPESDAFNGYANPLPYPHIVLYDAPLDPEWAVYGNALEGLFLHELTHVVSLSTRGPAARALRAAFGGWVLPAFLATPLFMVEGVTVSYESLDGAGRANDPLVRQRLSQAAADGAFLTPFQASGVYDKPPYGNAYYEYGGLFSAYLQKRWGMEKYAELWRAMGARFPLSLRFYRHGFYRIFREVYGEDFLPVWAAFAESLRVEGLEDNRANILVGGERVFDTLRSGGGRVFFADEAAGAVFAYDPAAESLVRVVGIDAAAGDIDVTADGKLLLVSSYRSRGARYAAEAVEYESASGRRTGRVWKGVLRPRYFREGVVGIAADGLSAPLVYRDGKDAETVLLRGGPARSFTSPAPLGDDRVAFIAAEHGVRSIGVYDFPSGAAYRLGTGSAGDGERFRFVRDLRASGGRLYFSIAEKEGFYRLGAADEGGFTLSARRFSGGVFSAVDIGGTLYYRAAFSTWTALARYPESAAALSGERLPIAAAPAFADDPAPETVPAALPDRPYSALAYLNPLRCWLPYPLVRTDGETWRLDGGGFLSYMSEPTDTQVFLLQGGWDAAGQMPFASLSWTNYGLGFPLAANFSDGIEFSSASSLDDPYRATRASASAGFSRGIGGERVSYSLGFSASALFYAEDPGDRSSAYEWNYADPIYAVGITAGLSDLRRPAWRLFGSGSSAAFASYLRLPTAEPRAEAVFRAAFEPFLPLRASAYAVWDDGGMAADGTSRVFGGAGFDGMVEYAASFPEDLRLLAGAEAEWKLFSLEAQGNFSHVYFNRFFGVLAYRGAVLPGEAGARFIQSAALKAGAVLNILPLANVPLRISPHLLAAWKLSELGDGNDADDWHLGFAMEIEW